MPNVSVPWGKEQLVVALPDHWKIQQVAEPALRPAAEGWQDRLARALSQPGTGLPLAKLLAARRTGRMEIIVEDVTRQSPLPEILGVIMREVRHAGIKDSQLELMFATGMHYAMSPQQAATKLGELAESIAWRCNPWQTRSAYVDLGRVGNVGVLIDRRVAGADLRIMISSVSPHLQAGFGGGYKMLLPGCAHLETIGALHRLGVYRAPKQLVGTEPTSNAMRRAIDQGGQLVDQHHGKTFAVQYLLDADLVPTFIAAGEPIPTHRMVAKQCAVACGVVMEGPADVLIVNAHPLDFDLWQSFKCIANTRWAVKPGGAIICLTRCREGLAGMKVPKWPLSPKWTRRVVGWLGPEALSSLVTRLIPRLAGDAAFFVRMALQTLHRNPIFMASPKLFESAGAFPGMELFGEASEAVAAADALLGHTPQRVAVFPSGGTTFPIPALPPGGGAAQ